jgi:hypothetical protein
MFRSVAKRFMSTSLEKLKYDNHAITVCSIILYTSVLSFAHRKETTEQNEQILKELKKQNSCLNNSSYFSSQ